MDSLDRAGNFEILAADVRDALRHWHNIIVLGSSPLAQLQCVTLARRKGGYGDTLQGRGLALRAVLREALNALPQPASEDSPDTKTTRPARVLKERYILVREIAVICQTLGIAQRTFHAAQARGINTIMEVLKAQEETSRLGENSPISNGNQQPSDNQLEMQHQDVVAEATLLGERVAGQLPPRWTQSGMVTVVVVINSVFLLLPWPNYTRLVSQLFSQPLIF